MKEGRKGRTRCVYACMWGNVYDEDEVKLKKRKRIKKKNLDVHVCVANSHPKQIIIRLVQAGNLVVSAN